MGICKNNKQPLSANFFDSCTLCAAARDAEERHSLSACVRCIQFRCSVLFLAIFIISGFAVYGARGQRRALRRSALLANLEVGANLGLNNLFDIF